MDVNRDDLVTISRGNQRITDRVTKVIPKPNQNGMILALYLEHSLGSGLEYWVRSDGTDDWILEEVRRLD